MIPVKQEFRHDPENGEWGDCHRACVASILELPLEAVPNFGHGGPDGKEFNRRVNEWLGARGLIQVHAVYEAGPDKVLDLQSSLNPGIYYILGGRSRNATNHSVVGLDDRVVHDPSIDGSGVVGPCDDGMIWVTWLTPFFEENE